MEEKKELVEIEMRQLIQTGYKGDIIDKMFKSARYYFRKKDKRENVQNVQNVQKREYCKRIDASLLATIDRHIVEYISLKPSESFALLFTTMDGFEEKYVKDRIKKTFQNRHYILRKKESVKDGILS